MKGKNLVKSYTLCHPEQPFCHPERSRGIFLKTVKFIENMSPRPRSEVYTLLTFQSIHHPLFPHHLHRFIQIWCCRRTKQFNTQKHRNITNFTYKSSCFEVSIRCCKSMFSSNLFQLSEPIFF